MKVLVTSGVAAVFAFASLGCHWLDDDALHKDLDNRELGAARARLDAALNAPRGGEPRDASGFAGLELLDRAVVRSAQGELTGAADDFAIADKSLDVGDLLRNTETRKLRTPDAFRYMYLRGWAQALNLPPGLKYYERLLLNPLAAIDRLGVGDGIGACVEARRYDVMADWTEGVAPGRVPQVRTFGEIVSAFACDAALDYAMACASYARAGHAFEDPSLARSWIVPRCRAASVSASPPPGAPADAELLVVVAYGRVSHPLKVPAKDGPGDVDIVGGGETAIDPDVAARVDDSVAVPLGEAVDVEKAARDDYAESRQAITVTILGHTARTGGWSPWAWDLLPAHVVIGVVPLAAGHHVVVVRVRGERSVHAITVTRGARVTVPVFAPW